jgi:hypothetical protein
MTKPTYDDSDLERVLRDALRHHAGDAPERLDAPVAGTLSAAAGDTGGISRRRRWVLPAVAAMAALAVPAGLVARNVLDVGGSGETGVAAGSPSATVSPSNSASTATVPDEWRVESYGGAQVRVPPTWGWGGAPAQFDWNGDSVTDCAGWWAYTKPGSSTYGEHQEGSYVGRPVMMTDVCGGGPPGHPTVDAVLLGAAGMTPGTETFPDGVIRETRAVGGTTVTAYSKNAALIAQVLGTAQAVTTDANDCPVQLPKTGPTTSWTGAGEPSRLSVCAYDRAGTLLFSDQHDATAAGAYVAGTRKGEWIENGSNVGRGDFHDHVVLRVEFTGSDGSSVRWDQFFAGPEGSYFLVPNAAGPTLNVPASQANIGPWAKDNGQVKAYVVGGPWSETATWQRWFRGILG